MLDNFRFDLTKHLINRDASDGGGRSTKMLEGCNLGERSLRSEVRNRGGLVHERSRFEFRRFMEGAMDDIDVTNEPWKLAELQRLWTIAKGHRWLRVKIDEDHRRPSNDALTSCVED